MPPQTHEMMAADAVWDAMRRLHESPSFSESPHISTLANVLHDMLLSMLKTELTVTQVLSLLSANPGMSLHLAVHRVLP